LPWAPETQNLLRLTKRDLIGDALKKSAQKMHDAGDALLVIGLMKTSGV